MLRRRPSSIARGSGSPLPRVRRSLSSRSSNPPLTPTCSPTPSAPPSSTTSPRRASSRRSLFALLRAHRVPCKQAAFNSLIRRFGRDGLPDLAVDLFHTLRSFEFSTSAPSVQSLNSALAALAALVENRRFEQARALLTESAASFGLHPNAGRTHLRRADQLPVRRGAAGGDANGGRVRAQRRGIPHDGGRRVPGEGLRDGVAGGDGDGGQRALPARGHLQVPDECPVRHREGGGGVLGAGGDDEEEDGTGREWREGVWSKLPYYQPNQNNNSTRSNSTRPNP